jgi:uncharacterized membrane protein YvlD (DUF360 family)
LVLGTSILIAGAADSTLPLTTVTPKFRPVINALMLLLVAWLVPGFLVSGLGGFFRRVVRGVQLPDQFAYRQ